MTFQEIATDFLRAVTSELDPYTSTKGRIDLSDTSGATLFTPSHIQFAKYGRGPGKQPPFDEIFQWVKREGIRFDNTTQEGTAWAIAKSIAKNGTSNWVPNAPNALQESIDNNIEKYFEDINTLSIQLAFDSASEMIKSIVPEKINYKI